MKKREPEKKREGKKNQRTSARKRRKNSGEESPDTEGTCTSNVHKEFKQ